ncbi:hypothetical protein [Herbiconiux sp. VKM Ac-2851]|uniref:hypothetical protein n=1 Tax=Herbiconiux sp. VKM Ac-2851 TaxID=2739025 RepID=UPI001564EFD9|nr:hypothetical protein [Herbiconiux sp. VKM Ac-2851]NQX36261.1 hypothetical protein [Herbiconiux sp. VKM Ac-2851]
MAEGEGQPDYHQVPAYAATEKAVHNDLLTVDVQTPFYHSLRAAALVLAREIDDVNSKASKAPLVKQLVDVIRELKGKDVAGGNSLEALLQDLSTPLVPLGGA